jgi:hypothetical protein
MLVVVAVSFLLVLVAAGIGIWLWTKKKNEYAPIPADLVDIIIGVSHSVAGEPSIASYTNTLDAYGYTNVIVSSDPQPLSPGLVHITPYSDGTFRKIEIHTHKDTITLYSSIPRSKVMEARST